MGKLEKVGVVGLGIIGSRVAERLRQTQRSVFVWSRSPKAEPNFLGSPSELARSADGIQIFVTDGQALLEVVETMLPQLKRKHVVMNHSTVDPASTRNAAALIEETGATFLDAPFTGSKQAAEDGNLVYYIGGEKAALDRARPILQVSSKEILHLGAVGDATVLKIATNMISGTTVQVLSEALAITREQGIEGGKLMEALSANACCSDLVRMKLPTMLKEEFEAHFSLRNMFKDAQLALEMANQGKIELPALSTSASMMFKQMQAGRGEDDYSALAANYPATSSESTDSDGSP
ncbi:MAG: NAD(P)-dependent oxidoreductase [Verrucomicrobiota bacterium]